MPSFFISISFIKHRFFFLLNHQVWGFSSMSYQFIHLIARFSFSVFYWIRKLFIKWFSGFFSWIFYWVKRFFLLLQRLISIHLTELLSKTEENYNTKIMYPPYMDWYIIWHMISYNPCAKTTLYQSFSNNFVISKSYHKFLYQLHHYIYTYMTSSF